MKRCKWKNYNCFKVEQKSFSIGPLKPWKVQNEVKPQEYLWTLQNEEDGVRGHTLQWQSLDVPCHFWIGTSLKAPFCACIGQTNWSIVGANQPSLWDESHCVLKGFWLGVRRLWRARVLVTGNGATCLALGQSWVHHVTLSAVAVLWALGSVQSRLTLCLLLRSYPARICATTPSLLLFKEQ